MQTSARPLTARPSEALSGTARVPGDKSISHRALMIGGLAVGESEILSLLEGEDVLRTAAAMRALGVEVECDGRGVWRLWGRGIGALSGPEDVLDMGNSGTGARLLMGVLAGHPVTAVLTGDPSLRRRPMGRVAAPLREMGAEVIARAGDRLPLTMLGRTDLLPIRYRLPVASAQVKSAVLLAGLSAAGDTTVIETEATRDHTELMLRHFGASVTVAPTGEARAVTVAGQPELSGRTLRVPADPSSAAFVAVSALLLPGSEIRLPDVCVNEHRTGLFTTLAEMGARIRFEDRREEAGEAVADLVVTSGPLEGVEVPAARAPTMIDEYPVLAVAAACAAGTTVMHGLGELRVKESDRLATMARGLTACGVSVDEREDGLAVHGLSGRPTGGATIEAASDHRVAMSFLVLGLAAERPITIDDAAPIDTSFPGFAELMRELGARIGAEGT